MKNNPTFEYQCKNCATKFTEVALNDYSYGEFIFWTKSGDCIFLNVFDNEVFDELELIFLNNFKNNSVDKLNFTDYLITIYSEVVCDKNKNCEVYQLRNPPCPGCGSNNNFNINEAINGYKVINKGKHENWKKMTNEEKNVTVLELVETLELFKNE